MGNIIKVRDNIWKIKGNGNVYLLNLKKKIVIDTGIGYDKELIKKQISEITSPDDIEIVIFTHLHYDHISNFDLFPNAEFYCSKEEKEDYLKNKFGAILNQEIVKSFNTELNDIDEIKDLLNDDGIQIFHVSGHTKGSIALFHKELSILFSGDTIFDKGHGRIDLPTSSPNDMDESVKRLKSLNYRILCPGHDY